jgi:hypothetical protein
MIVAKWLFDYVHICSKDDSNKFIAKKLKSLITYLLT